MGVQLGVGDPISVLVLPEAAGRVHDLRGEQAFGRLEAGDSTAFASHHSNLPLDALQRALDRLAMRDLDLSAAVGVGGRPERGDFLGRRVAEVDPGHPGAVGSGWADGLLGDWIEALHQGSQVLHLDCRLRVDPEAAQEVLRAVPLRGRRLATLAVVGVVVTPRSFGEEIAREPDGGAPLDLVSRLHLTSNVALTEIKSRGLETVKHSQIKVITQSKKVKEAAPSVRRVCAFEKVTAPAGTGQARRALTCFYGILPEGP